MSHRTIDRDRLASVYVTPAGDGQVYVTACPAKEATDSAAVAAAAYQRIARVLKDRGMAIVHERVFGNLDARLAVTRARREALNHCGIADSPVTYIQGRPCRDSGLAGINLQAVIATRQPDNTWCIYDDGGLVGRGWKRNGAAFLMLQNLHGLQEAAEGQNTRQKQAKRMFERADRILQAQGSSYRQVVRTWIYLSKLLDWYNDFNEVRNSKYYQLGIMPEIVRTERSGPLCLPASTGIEGESPLGAACMMDVLAVAGPSDRRPVIEQMTNIKQEDAFRYGSAFSRGAYIRESDVTSILISGTAAIDAQGKSLYPGDVRSQILATFDNVETLIREKGASLRGICDATIFLKRAEDIAIYEQVAAERGLAEMPAVCCNCDVCRGELLFELDGVAIIAG